MSYDEALLIMAIAIDVGGIDFWDASIALAILFDKTKEGAGNDLIAMRSKAGVTAIPRIAEEGSNP